MEDRTLEFAKRIVRMCQEIPNNTVNFKLIDQIIRSAGFIGANYREANGASSKKDFKNKIFICRKEIQETKYWIELLVEVNPDVKDSLKRLWKESHELTLIFNKISSSLKESLKN